MKHGQEQGRGRSREDRTDTFTAQQQQFIRNAEIAFLMNAIIEAGKANH